ncbi:MAG: carboxypeptidase-like regulatory domain-containing protein, partial [Balneolaceae bacterium]
MGRLPDTNLYQLTMGVLLFCLCLVLNEQVYGQGIKVVSAESFTKETPRLSQLLHLAPPDVDEKNREALNKVISVDLAAVPMEDALQYIADLGDLRVAYSKGLAKNSWKKPVSIQFEQATILGALYAVLGDTDLRLTLSSNSGNGQLVVTKGSITEVSADMPEPIIFEQTTVTGTVTDASSDATLPGVNVVVQGTTTGTVTDVDGSFSLNVPSLNDTLVVSYIGYQIQEIPLNGRTDLDIALESQVLRGEEMVVTAFGLQREQRSLSYSTQGVQTAQMTEARELNVMNSLQGRVAGLTINQSGSGVGASTRVVLRGNRSISGDSQPLYVVDGVPIRGNPTDLNPDNI